MSHGFRFGRTLFTAQISRASWRDEASRAEQAGFGTIHVTDHFGSTGGIFSALQAAWEAAPSMRVGTLVLNNDFWHPSLLAREVVTADTLTEGHFELGLGAGWDEPDYRAMGLGRAPASERIERLDESLQVLRQAFSGQAVDFQGRFFSVAGEAPWPQPIQGRIPILIGGGTRPILDFAARRADIVSIHRNLQRGLAGSWEAEKRGSSEFSDAVSQRVEWVREAAGERFAELELHALVLKTVFTDRRAEVAADLGRGLGLSAEQILASPHYLLGDAGRMAEDLRRRRERWGINYWTVVGIEDVSAFRAVIASLEGA